MDYSAIPLINNTAIHNFEMHVDGHRAFIDYRAKDDRLYLVHTEVPEALEGRGIAGALVEKTLQYMEQHHLKLVPMCAYVKHYLNVHPEWNRLLV